MSIISLALAAALAMQPSAGAGAPAKDPPEATDDTVSGVVIAGRPQLTEQQAIAAFSWAGPPAHP